MGACTGTSFKFLKAHSCSSDIKEVLPQVIAEYKGLAISTNPGIKRQQYLSASKNSLTCFSVVGIKICSMAANQALNNNLFLSLSPYPK